MLISSVKQSDLVVCVYIYIYILFLIFHYGLSKDTERSSLLVGMQVGATTLEDSMEVPQRTKNRIII